VRALVIGCAGLLVIGCSGTRSEAPQEEGQGHTEATKKEQTRPPEATASEKGRCEGTRTFKRIRMSDAVLTTNDLPDCPKGGLLSGTDKHDTLAGEDGEDEVRGLGAGDFIFGGSGDDVIYGGPGRDNPLIGDEGDDIELHGDGDGQRDKLYCGEGRDSYMADKVDYVSSSCEVKLRPSAGSGNDVIYGGPGRDELKPSKSKGIP